jgi:hypothetical protein
MKIDFYSNNFHLYPEQPFEFNHFIDDTSLLTLDEIAKAAEEMPVNLLEYTTTVEIPQNISHGELVRSVVESKKWIFLRNLEYIPRYKIFMKSVINALVKYGIQNQVIENLKDYFNPMSFIFISSPHIVTPFHIDPEHNFLFQISGIKKVYVNNSFMQPIISDQEVENFYVDEVGFILKFDPVYLSSLDAIDLTPGKGVYIPVAYPHMVFNGDNVSISYSLTFRTKVSDRHRKVHLVNRALRLLGLTPRKYGESDISDLLKYQLFPLLNYFINK